MKKPANLVYGVEENPPRTVAVVCAVQHIGVVAIFMIYPLILGRQAGLPDGQVAAMLQMGMIAMATAVLLQAPSRGPIGSGFLAPCNFTGTYLAPSLLAVKMGGMPMVWGMTIFAGLVEIGLSRVWPKLRTFIPPETAGLVVFLIGVIVGLAALRVLLDHTPDGTLAGSDTFVALITIGVMVGLNIWNKGKLRLFCILIGMAVGYVLSGFTGHITGQQISDLFHQPLFALPTMSHVSWSFDWSLAIPFAVTGLAAAMGATASITTLQRLNDAEWVRPDMKSIGGGVFSDGIGAAVGGFLGTYGMSISTANVGLTAATGVASRVIAYTIAALLILCALQPTLIGVLIIMPLPVMSAALLFSAVFIMISGIQIITSRVLDPRRTLVIGMGMMAFFVVSVFPKAFAGAPLWAQPLLSSPLVLATLVALSLNLLFRLGIRRTVTMSIDRASLDLQEVVNFIERNAGIGARGAMWQAASNTPSSRLWNRSPSSVKSKSRPYWR